MSTYDYCEECFYYHKMGEHLFEWTLTMVAPRVLTRKIRALSRRDAAERFHRFNYLELPCEIIVRVSPHPDEPDAGEITFRVVAQKVTLYEATEL